MTAVGKGISHESARGHVTGEALYTDDLVSRVTGAAYAWPVQSPHAHARVLRVGSARALELPGVLAVLTADDVGGKNDIGPARPDEPLFPSEVMYDGQAVAWVVAETEEQARLGAEAVEVDYEPLPAIVTIEQAIEGGSFLTDPLVIRRGDVDRGLGSSAHRLSGELTVGGQEHFYLETQTALAYVDEGGSIFVQSSTQHPSETQAIVARVLGVPKNDVVVQCVRMGGAFGGKEVQANAWATVAAMAAVKLGRPVSVRLSRLHDVVLTGKRHPFLGRFDVGFDDEGKLEALKLELFSDGGWCLDLSEPVMFRAMFHSDNCYFIEHLSVVGRVCQTHKTSQTAFRGFGGPQGMVVIEDIVGRVAGHLGRPPHEVRATNFYREGQKTHYDQLVTRADRIGRIYGELSERCDFERRWAEIAELNRAQAHVKRGLAITPVKFGISFTTAFFNQAGALVLVYQDGSVQVNHGGTEMGQGLHTKMLQVAADSLGVPLETVRAMPTRTDKVPNTSATAASSGSDLNGAAVKRACETIRGRLAEVAAQRFGVNPDDVVFEDGRAHAIREPGNEVAFVDLVRQAYLERIPLFATGYYRTPNIHYDKAKGTGKPFHYFSFGAAATEVEVDTFTGQYALRRVDILHDVGDSLSPLIDIGQIEGGFIQGVGWLTTEELCWSAEGRLLTRGASTYKLPTVGECPEVFNVALLEQAAEPSVVYGSKAVGEPPLMLAISVREALRHAVSAFGRGVVDLPSPATPEAVFWAIERARKAASDARAAE